MSERIKTVFIVGPTASGKTALSIDIAKKFDGEIVSADSMQIYKGIHIASAAPDESEKAGVPHHLIEFLNIQEAFSVADYVKTARECIFDINERGKLPIIVGGTGLYINSLTDNIEFVEEETDYNLRHELEVHFDEIGAEEMLKELSVFDPDSALRLHPNNRRRIIRAFEVFRQTGKTITEQNRISRLKPSPLDLLMIGITYKNREALYERINKRVDVMIKNGLIEEAKSTFGNNVSKGAYQAIGHKELYKYFEGTSTLNDAAEELKKQTRRYAKRQLTWFLKDKRIKWIYADEVSDINENCKALVENFLIKEGN